MRRLRKFLARPAREQWLLLKATAMVTAAVVGLRLLPFRTLRAVFRPGAASSEPKTGDTLERIVSAVQTTERVVPWSSCLSRALVAERLLQKAGYPAQLRISVRNPATALFEAHAWVESGGRVVLEAHRESQSYRPLPVIPQR